MKRDGIINLINTQYDKNEDKVNICLFEVLEDECETIKMDIAEFKQIAKNAGLIVEDQNKDDETINDFEVVEE